MQLRASATTLHVDKTPRTAQALDDKTNVDKTPRTAQALDDKTSNRLQRQTHTTPQTHHTTAKPPTHHSKPPNLVLADKVSPDRLSSPYIKTAYRPDGCDSLSTAFFTLHNQTGNIWTHALGLLVVGRYLDPWPAPARAAPHAAALQAHAVVALCVGVFSVAYHAGEALAQPWRGRLLAYDLVCAFIACGSHGALIAYCELSATQPQACAWVLGALGASVFAGAALFLSGHLSYRPMGVQIGVMGLPLALGVLAWALACPTPSTPLLARWCLTFALTVAVWVA